MAKLSSVLEMSFGLFIYIFDPYTMSGGSHVETEVQYSGGISTNR